MCITMKVKTVIPEKDRKQIEYYQSKILEIKESHIDEINLLCDYSLRGIIKYEHKIKEDPLIKMYEKLIEYIYIYAVPQLLLIPENDEDKKLIERIING